MNKLSHHVKSLVLPSFNKSNNTFQKKNYMKAVTVIIFLTTLLIITIKNYKN